MDEQATDVTDAQILQIMVTEHSNLQAIRSGTIFEANGRTNVFLGTVSSVVIALAFVGQVTEMGGAFTLFALILLPTLMFMGVVTFFRVEQAALEDMLATRGINRIRNYYTQVAPRMEKYFILSTHDDLAGMMWNMGMESSSVKLFVSAAGLVSVINGILTAVFAGLLIYTVFGTSAIVSTGIGIAAFVVVVWLSYRYQGKRFDAVNTRLRVLYPSETLDRD